MGKLSYLADKKNSLYMIKIWKEPQDEYFVT